MREHFLERLVANLVTRIIYFIGSCAAVFFFMGYRSWQFASEFPATSIAFVVAAGLLGALFGPMLYTLETQRGRGSLKEIRARSPRSKGARQAPVARPRPPSE